MATTKPTLHILTLGHRGHGKSMFTAALAGVYGAMPPVALTMGVSGITVTGSLYEYDTAQRHIVHLDGTRSTENMKYLLAGNPLPDAAIVVVAGDEGPIGETREQLALARAVGIRNLIVFINKCDSVVNEELVAPIESACRELLCQVGFSGDDVPVVRGSALRALEGDSAWTQKILDLAPDLDGFWPTVASLQPSPHTKYECGVYLRAEQEGGRERPFDAQYTPTVRIRDTEVVAKIALPMVPWVLPGDWTQMVHTLAAPIPLVVGQRLTMREGGRVVGLGCVTKILE